MTVPASLNLKSGPFDGDGSTTTFSFPWPIFEQGEVAAYVKDSNGDVTQLVPTVDYTVDDKDQVVRLDEPLAQGSTMLLTSDYQQEQDLDFTSQGRFFPQTHEKGYDYAVLLIKQLYRELQQIVASSNPFGTDLSVNSITVGGESITNIAKEIIRDAAPGIVREVAQADVTVKTADFTVQPEGYNTVFLCDSGQDITVTLPAGLDEGFFCGIVRRGTGRVLIEGDGSSTVSVAQPFLQEVRTLNSIVSATRLEDSTEEWLLTGDLVDSFYP